MAPLAITDPTECTFCHAVIPSADKTCVHCGWVQEQPKAQQDEKVSESST